MFKRVKDLKKKGGKANIEVTERNSGVCAKRLAG